MHGRLPNLNSLRVFEAAARHESLTRAAEELSVTQSAVSKQVAALEAYFGQPLFERQHKRIILTPFGREVFKAADLSIATLRERLDMIGTPRAVQIRLVADADFVQLWLFPRLPDFENAFPDIRISLETRTSLQSPPPDGYDCAIIWGRGAWRNCRFHPLMTNTVFAVCAPGWFDELGHPASLNDVPDDMLIHDRSTFWWSALRAAYGARDFDPEAGRIYNQTSLCLEAAARGDGLTIGDEVTTTGYLQQERLTIAFPNRLPSPDSYFLVTPSGGQWSDEMEAFSAWLTEQSKDHVRWWQTFWSEQDGA